MALVEHLRPEVQARWARLSPREQEVSIALAQGAGTREIAHRLGISPQTVDTHICKLIRKLEVKNRAEALAWAWTHGLIKNP